MDTRFAALAAERPGATALVDADLGLRIGYADLQARADAIAVDLAARGIGPGGRVALLSHQHIDAWALLLACARLRAALVPLNDRLARPELSAVLAHARPSLLVSAPETEAQALGIAGSVPHSTLASLGAPGRPPRPTGAPDDTVLVLYTSGSTGAPKGVRLTHRSLLANAAATMVGWALRPDDVALQHAPLFHTGGWNVFGLPLLLHGGTLVLTRRFAASRGLDAIPEHGVTCVFGVPTMWADLDAEQRARARDLRSLRFAISGGAPLPLPLVEAWARHGVPLKQGFGLTEVGPNCFAFPDGLETSHAGWVGVPMPGLDVRLVDESGIDVPDGVPGELWLRGESMSPGYLDDAGTTSASRSTDGFFRTGDVLVRLDGLYRVAGRKKEMFISGGENVFPGEVEAALLHLPSVREAAVVAAPHPRWGEAGVAFVVGGDPDTLIPLLRERIGGYKVPRLVIAMEALPRGATGKVDKRALTQRAIEETEGSWDKPTTSRGC